MKLSAKTLRRQPLKSQNRSRNHMAERVDEQIGPVSAIKTKFHFLQVGCEMFSRNLVPRSHDATLEQRERILRSIRVDFAHDVDAGLVPNDFVLGAVYPGPV